MRSDHTRAPGGPGAGLGLRRRGQTRRAEARQLAWAAAGLPLRGAGVRPGGDAGSATPAQRHPRNAAAQHPPPREFPVREAKGAAGPHARRAAPALSAAGVGLRPRRPADVRPGTPGAGGRAGVATTSGAARRSHPAGPPPLAPAGPASPPRASGRRSAPAATRAASPRGRGGAPRGRGSLLKDPGGCPATSWGRRG